MSVPPDMPMPGNGNEAYDLSSVSAETSALQFRRIVQVLIERLWVIVLVLVLSLLAAFIYLRKAPRIYQAKATVEVANQQPQIVNVAQVMQQDLKSQEVLNTIVDKLRSPPLLARVVESNDLVGVFRNSDGVVMTNEDAIVAVLGKDVTTTLRRLTRLIDIKVLNTNPKLAALIANSIVEQYLSQNAEIYSDTSKGAYGGLKNEAKKLQEQLTDSEQKLQNYQQQVGSVSISQNQDALVARLQIYYSQLSQARMDTLKAKAQYDQITNVLGQPGPQSNRVNELLLLPQLDSNPMVAQARQDYIQAKDNFSMTKLRYKWRHPNYQLASNMVVSAREELIREAMRMEESRRMAYDLARMTEKSMEQALAQAEQKALDVSSQAIQFNLLSREVDTDQALFSAVLNRLKETSVAQNFQPEDLRLIQAAAIPNVPVSPRLLVVLALALFVGVGGGCMVALGLNTLDLSIQSQEDAETALRQPVLSVVTNLKELQKKEEKLLPIGEAGSVGAEAFRTLRTVLVTNNGNGDAQQRSFLITSAFSGEGKTFCAINFAHALASTGLKTLIIDADLRRPSVEKYLNGSTEDHPGLTDLLEGRVKLRDVVRQKDGAENLWWLPAGADTPQPAELLGRGGFKQVLDDALNHFDRVVIDSAPVCLVSDTLLIAPKVNTTVLVIRSHKTPRHPIRRGLALLENAGARLSGLVLNAFPLHRGGYYDHYYYHGYYDDYVYGKRGRGYGSGRRSRGGSERGKSGRSGRDSTNIPQDTENQV